MAKNIKRYSQYIEESDDFGRKKKLKKESRHNYKVELEQSIDNELWDEMNDDEDSDNNR
ncbi:hypothetical protein N9F71_00410 [bacterium]|jgi:hypothetical protein|nr:hypothetical protein [bacterium]MDB4435736.1 hypothetical protein [bacterium]|tara:strand:+ start:418 stop:594 length:177 start_codon:yes stop_codon:yes gene_type:complete